MLNFHPQQPHPALLGLHIKEHYLLDQMTLKKEHPHPADRPCGRQNNDKEKYLVQNPLPARPEPHDLSLRTCLGVGPEPLGIEARLNSLEKRDKCEWSFLIEKLSQAVHSAPSRTERI